MWHHLCMSVSAFFSFWVCLWLTLRFGFWRVLGGSSTRCREDNIFPQYFSFSIWDTVSLFSSFSAKTKSYLNFNSKSSISNFVSQPRFSVVLRPWGRTERWGQWRWRSRVGRQALAWLESKFVLYSTNVSGKIGAKESIQLNDWYYITSIYRGIVGICYIQRTLHIKLYIRRPPQICSSADWHIYVLYSACVQ